MTTQTKLMQQEIISVFFKLYVRIKTKEISFSFKNSYQTFRKQ